MRLFGQLVRTAVNVVALPFVVAADVVMLPVDAGEDRRVGQRTAELIQKLKDEAE